MKESIVSFPKEFYAVLLPVMALDTPGEYTVLVMFLSSACDIWLVRGLFNCALSTCKCCLALSDTRVALCAVGCSCLYSLFGAAFLAYLRVVRLLLYGRTEQKLRIISFRVQDYAVEIRTVHISYTGCPINLQLESR